MNQLINLKNSHFKNLVVNHVSLDEVFLLQLAIQSLNLEDFKEKKISLLIKKMIRNGLLTEEGVITQAGKNLYNSLFEEGDEINLTTINQVMDDFDRWWTTFPGTTTIKIDNKVVFKGDRSIRVNRDKCRIKFHQIIAEGPYSADDIINALKYEVQQKIEKSLKTKDNKLTYMQNSLTWLNQRSFEPFIEEAKNQPEEKKTLRKTTNWEL